MRFVRLQLSMLTAFALPLSFIVVLLHRDIRTDCDRLTSSSMGPCRSLWYSYACQSGAASNLAFGRHTIIHLLPSNSFFGVFWGTGAWLCNVVVLEAGFSIDVETVAP